MQHDARSIRSRRPCRTGFTLVEVIATIVVLGIVGTGVSMIMTNAVRGYLDGSVSAEIQAELSVVLDRVVREFRAIDLDPDVAGVAPDIDAVTATSISWQDADDDVSAITLSGTDLMLAVDGAGARVLVRNVSAVTITCYDEDNAAMAASLAGAACDDIRRIQISISVTREGITRSLRSRIYLRCTLEGSVST